MALIELRDVFKIFGPHPKKVLERVRGSMSKDDVLAETGHTVGLRDVSLSVEGGQTFVIMGLSGSGKSTLIRHLNRLIDPTAGDIVIDGTDIMGLSESQLRAFRRHKMSMVFQRFGLFPHKSVLHNVAYGLDIQGLDAKVQSEQAMRWIERVGLSGYEGAMPAELSGGMQQRVGLARALCTDSDILLMDEPFSALDPLIRRDMQDQLVALQGELHKTIVFITHDLDEALRIGVSVAILRDGEVVQRGDPQSIVLAPADDYVADFVKDVNRGKVIKVDTIMRPPTDEAEGPAVDADTLLEDVARIMTSERTGWVRVVGAAGEIVGAVSTADVMASMVRRTNDGDTAQAAE